MTAIPLRLRRRAAGGAAGAPSSLLTAELAWNQADGLVYGGYGDNGSGGATSVKVMFGEGFIANVPAGGDTGQVLTKASGDDGDLEWADPVGGGGGSYDAGTGIDITGDTIAIDQAITAKLASPTFTGVPAAPTAAAATDTTQIATTAFVHDVVDDYAPLASPSLTGNPTAPTQSSSNNSTRLATTAFVATAIANLVASAPGALDTLDELAAALGDDENFAATVTSALAGKQPLDATLTALAGLTIASNKLVIGSGTDAFSVIDFPANSQSLVQAANYAAMRVLLGVDVIDGGTF